mgnify:CR=1 FL=1
MVTRVYKRVAMSKGGFSGKGIFATLSYLVVEFDRRTGRCAISSMSSRSMSF